MTPQSSGYSISPLSRKLGIVVGCRIVVRHPPPDYRQLLEPLPDDVVFDARVTHLTDIVHVFVDRRAALESELAALRNTIRPNAVVWVSWPKRSSRVPTDITEDTIRQVALPLGFVDTKVCAVTDVWSGLKLVIRKEHRRP